jgi:hypothetical protein
MTPRNLVAFAVYNAGVRRAVLAAYATLLGVMVPAQRGGAA